MLKVLLVILLIILAVSGAVFFLTGPVEVFRDIRTPFEIDFAEDIAQIFLVSENGTLIKPAKIQGHPGDVAFGFRALFDYPHLFHFHAYAPFYNPSAIYQPWKTVGHNELTFVLIMENNVTIVYLHVVSEGAEYWGDGEHYYFHVRPGISLYLPNHPYFEWIKFNATVIG